MAIKSVKLGFCLRKLLAAFMSVLTGLESCSNASCKAGSCSYSIDLVKVSIEQ